jgi:hypothetical protein
MGAVLYGIFEVYVVQCYGDPLKALITHESTPMKLALWKIYDPRVYFIYRPFCKVSV